MKAQKIEDLEKRLEEYRIFIAKQNRPQPEGGKQGSLIQSKTSEAANSSIGADSVSKLNDEAGAEEGKQPVATKGETPAADYQNRQHTVAVHKDLFERILDYKVTADEVKASFNSLIEQKESLLEELGQMTKPELLDRFPAIGIRYKNERKDRVIEAAYNDMLDDFALRNSISWGMSSGLDGYAAGVRAFIEKITDEDVRAYADKVNAARSEREAERQGRNAGMQEPKTLDDFQNLLRSKMGAGLDFKQARLSLSPEQRATFDDLTASKTMAERAGRKENQKTEVRVAGQTVSGQIIETKHTKKGHDLYVVQLSERIERDDYNTLNAGAKSLGGYYSAFRGNGAVPGFQFTTRENAEAFVALTGGNKEAAQDAIKERRDAFEDDRSQSAVERLTEMAAKLEERADSELNRDRKVNTTRRAGMAERAERAASAEKATATTMRNIANAIQTGSAKYLGQVRQKSQVEYLQRVLTSAQFEMLRQQYPSYADQEKHKFDAMTPEVADYAEFPGYRLRRSDWAALGRAMVEIDGLKTDGKRILSVADDVTAAYLKFAKENITKVGVFANQKGERAVFASKADAENSISRSGFKGKAVVLPFKRGENLIVLSPAEAQLRGIWRGDDDQYIEVRSDFGAELVQKIGKANRRAAKVELPWQLENAHDRREKLRRMGIETPAEFRAALREMISLRETPAESDKVKKLERAMVGRRNDGLDFFPTPSSTADEMVEAADIKDGMTVLEPSAGWGHIAERIRETGVEPDVVEISGDRRELLEAKGFNVVASDFMDLTEQYDRIIMNPPFSDRRDEAHVRHAYELLKPNGRLVAIMGEGVFFGSDRRAGEFRDWLEAVGGTSEKLESGTFMDPALPVTTSVAARMVVIDKRASTAGQGVALQEPVGQYSGYETDLFGDPLPNSGNSRLGDSAASGTASALLGDAEFYVETILGTTRKQQLGANRIITPADAAAATQYLYRSAVEHFDAVVTDADGKPLAVVGSFKGAINEASVYASTLVAEATAVPGAKKIWFSHNHPSGIAQLSNADKNLEAFLADLFDGSGIKAMGLLAVSGERFDYKSTLIGNAFSGNIAPSKRGVAVPVQERELIDAREGKWVLDSPTRSKEFAAKIYERTQRPGVILLDSQNAVAAWLPASDVMLGKLRGTGGLNAIYRAVGRSNATAAILVHAGELDAKVEWVTAGQNIAAALKKVDVRILDSINVKTRVSAAERGADMYAGPVFSSSAMKSVDANIQRGKRAMNQVILDRADVARAMYHNELGWIDFVWGDNLRGVQHIVYQRIRKDGMTEQQIYQLLTDGIVNTIASGEVLRHIRNEKSSKVVVRGNGNQAVLVKSRGGNGWLLTGFELIEPVNQGGGATAPGLLSDAPIRSRGTVVATLNELSALAEQAVNNPALSRGAPGGMPVDVVQTITDAIGQRWKGAPEIIVVSDMNDARIRKVVRDENQRQLSQGATGEPEGFFDAGKVYVVASQMRSVNDVVRVLFHETLGHAGLRGVFGEELKPILRQIANMRNAEVAAKAAEYGLDMEVESDRLIAAEEVLAVMAQTKPDIGFVKRAIAAIRAWLRQHVPGFAKMQMTDNDIIANFILPARRFIESGRAEQRVRGGQQSPLPAMSRNDARAILNGEPVASLHSEDAPNGGFAAVVDWAAEIFASQGGKAVREGFGEVALDRRAAKDSMAHGGANRYKKVAFAAVKDVIERGALIHSESTSELDSFYFSAPVFIDGLVNVETVLVHRDVNTNRMYLHSVISKEGLLGQGVSSADDSSSKRAGSTASEGIARILQNLMTDNQGDGNTAFSRASTTTPEGVMGSGARRAALGMGVMNKALDVLKQPSMRTFGVISGIRTQLDKARQDPAGFGRVFDLMVGFENDLRRTAARPSTLAPSIFPVDNEGMVNGLKKLLKGKQNSAADKAVADALFDGTLDGDDAFSGKVFTDAELRDRGFTPAQITKYREARAVVDASLMEAAAATAFQMAQKYIPGHKDAIRDNPAMASDLVPSALENAAQRVQDKIASTTDPKELGRLENQLLSITETIDAVNLVFERVGQLQQAGYMPLMRFGKYTVTGYDATGAVEYHARFDTETEAKLAESWAKGKFERAERGIAPTNPNTLFAGVDPETVSLFVNQLGVKFGDESVNESVMQEWYRRAVSERSAWKRMINRKGTPGYDDDIERVLASFITSNARFAAQAYNRGGILDAMNFLQTDPEYKRRGDVFDEANKLKEYMDNPEEPFAVGRSLMFTWFLGGSISSAVVNLTQPVLMTFPYLSQWGPAKASQYLAGAAKDAVRPTGIQDQGMKDALARASEMGIVEPQEIHHLYRLGMKSLLSRVPSGENFRTRLQGAGQMWGYLFGQAEKFNRRLTFIAAYRMAVDNPDLGDAYEFAERAVEETQGIYSKANRPNWARGTGSLGAVGAAAFTFKQYSIAYVELLRRMWMAGPEGKRAAGIMLGMLVLASGLQGLPFADDGEDALDTALQFMGREGNTKADVRNWALDMLGEEAGLFALYGVSAFLPLDIQSRLGMANLIPSTTLLKPSEDNKARALGELFGAPGSYLTDIADAISAWEAGKSGVDTLIEMAPVAIKNLNKGFDMATDGFYSDTRGKKVVDTDAGDSFIKGVLGFQPTKVSMETRRLGSIQQSVSRVKQKEGDIADLLAQGRFEGNQEKIQRAMQMLNEWNERNPNLRISIAPRQIIQRVRAMAITREQRLLKTIPKELRPYLLND